VACLHLTISNKLGRLAKFGANLAPKITYQIVFQNRHFYQKAGLFPTINKKGVTDVGSPLNVTDADFQSEVVEADVPVLVDFWATWCGPCRMIAPAIEELANEYEGRVKVVKVDVDNAQQTAQGFGIRSIPTLLIFQDGKVADQLVGAVPKSAIEDKLNTVLS